MYLIVVDAKLKWIEVLSMMSTTAAATIRALRFLFSVHGLPKEMVSNNGPQFVAKEMKDFTKSNGIRHRLSSPYHPASNGEAERAMRTFKEAMKLWQNDEGSTGEKLAQFLLGYRTTSRTTTGSTPAEILMGRRLQTRLDLLHPSLSGKMERKSKDPPQFSPRKFEIGDLVMVKDYRVQKEPWVKRVIQIKLSQITYRVQVGDLFWKRHVDQLQSLAGSAVADVNLPPLNMVRQSGITPNFSAAGEVRVADNSHYGQFKEQSANNTSTQEIDPLSVPQPLVTLTKDTLMTVSNGNNSGTGRYPPLIRMKPKRLIQEI